MKHGSLAFALGLVVVGMGCDDSTRASRPGGSTPTAPAIDLSRPRVGFLVENGTFDSELVAPLDIFHHTPSHAPPGFSVCTIARSRDPIRTYEGLCITPDFDYASAPPLEILVVPSAERHVREDFDDPELIAFVTARAPTAKWVISLCDGAFVLAKAGVLDDRRCTTFPGDIAKLRERYPKAQVLDNVSFVVDRNVITSVGGAKSYDPALFVVERTFGSDIARAVGRGLVIEWEARATRFVEFASEAAIRSYRLGDRIDPEVAVENADGSRVPLLSLAGEDRVIVLILFGAAASLGDPPHAGMWCEDSFHELGLYRHAIARFDAAGAAFVAVACPPRFAPEKHGFRAGAFDPGGDPGERKRFAELSQQLVSLGVLPFQKLHFDFELELIRDVKKVPLTDGEPGWIGRFRPENEFQTYGTPAVWILSRNGDVLAPPFHANNWEKDGVLRHGPRELEAAIARALAITPG